MNIFSWDKPAPCYNTCELHPIRIIRFMISLDEFFALNREIILFIYGLGFFILGFAIILQTQKSSRLELARSLR